eukprot:365228-Chlamydomonas_euryale.AAC.1
MSILESSPLGGNDADSCACVPTPNVPLCGDAARPPALEQPGQCDRNTSGTWLVTGTSCGQSGAQAWRWQPNTA